MKRYLRIAVTVSLQDRTKQCLSLTVFVALLLLALLVLPLFLLAPHL